MFQKFQTSFNDFLFIMALLFMSLLVLSLKPVKKESDNNTVQKVEFMITLEWDKDSENDIDLYLEDPAGNIVFFKVPSSGLSNLERDDRGTLTDTVIDAEGNVISYMENVEKIAIRGIIPGEYTIAIHMYNKHDSKGTIKVKMEKMNPYGIVFFQDNITQLELYEERFIKRFTLSDKGEILSLNNLEKQIVPLKPAGAM